MFKNFDFKRNWLVVVVLAVGGVIVGVLVQKFFAVYETAESFVGNMLSGGK